MNAAELVTQQDLAYLVETRRAIHRHPELGFDLDNTVSIVCNGLKKAGIEPILTYGRCSVAAYIGPADAKLTVGIRADMDALPVEEKTGLPYASQIPGRMHACGHDAHTAILLTVARVLKRHESALACRVKLLFQPSEECEVSGAKMMVDNGAADDVDFVLCTHCENTIEAGMIGIHPGRYMAACDPITITFHGRTAHAALAEQGIDALQMAVRAYTGMKDLVPKLCGDEVYVFSIGSLRAGEVHNVVPDLAVMKVSFRYYNDAMRETVRSRCMELCRAVASEIGGSVEFDWQMSAPALYNDEALTESFRQSIEAVMPGTICQMPMRKSTEDFAWFLRKKPGMIFRIGTRNEALGCTALAHRNDFRIDESGLANAVRAFVQFMLDQPR